MSIKLTIKLLSAPPVAVRSGRRHTAGWVDEFERVQLLLRLSPKMRECYGD